MSEQQTTRNTFTEDGRLLQAEFAIKNVSEAGTIAGMVCTDGVILLGINLTPSATIEKVYQINEKTYSVVSGIFSDALRLIKFARLECANARETTGLYPKVSILCDKISMEKQSYTQMAGARPFGVSFLFSGYENGEYVLYSTDPSGTVNRWRACCFGLDSDAINGGLRNDLPEAEYTVEEGILNLLRIMGKAKEWGNDTAERMEVLLFSEGGARMMKIDEIKNIIKLVEDERIKALSQQ